MKCIPVLLVFVLALGSCARQPPAPPATIVIAVQYDPDSLDPHQRNTISNFVIASHFYEPLVRTDGVLRVRPALADSWENPDPRTWIFHLNRSARFHSGKGVHATDVVESFRRLISAENLEMRSFISGLESITAVDSDSVQIRTQKPMSFFLNNLNFVHILPEGGKISDPTQTVNGTGPYRLAGKPDENSIQMFRNDRYYGSRPEWSEVTFLLNRTPEQAIQDLLSGRAQLIQGNTRMLEESVRESSSRFEILVQDSLFMQYLGFDMDREETPYCKTTVNPFRSRLVRQAMYFGIDRTELVKGLSVFSVPASQPVPPFVFGYNPAIPIPDYNPGLARRLLAEAGYPDGFEVTLHSRKIFEEASEILREQLARIGIQLSVRLLSSGEFYGAMDRRDASLFLTGMGSPTGDAGTVLEDSFHSRDALNRLGDSNFGGYSNPDLDSLIEKSSGITSTQRRLNMLKQIMFMLMEDLPWVPLYYDQEAYAMDRAYDWQPRYDGYIFAHEIRRRGAGR